MYVGKIGSNSIVNMTEGATRSVAQASDESFAQKLEQAFSSSDEKALKTACQEFESIMLNMMYKQMKATIIQSNLVEKDVGSDIYESMLDENLMEAASKTGSFGLAESLYKQLSKNLGSRGKDGE